jgi:autotransporter-associated beta strand protein
VTAGLQSGDGVWGLDSFWSATTAGTTLGTWTSGNVAEFRAQSSLPVTVTVSGAQSISGMTFTSAATGATSDWRFDGAGSLVVDAYTTINTGSGKVTIANAISGTRALDVAGSPGGKLVFSGNNTSTGATTVRSGTLQVDGSITGLTTVLGGAYLTGSGVFGDVVVAANSYLNAGAPNAVGAMTMQYMNLMSLSTVYWDLANAAAAAGVGYDTFNVGVLDVGTLSATSKFSLSLSGRPSAFDASKNARFTLLSYRSLSTGFNFPDFSEVVTIDTLGLKDASGAAISADRFTLANNAATKTLDLVYTAPIPEPSTCGLALGALSLGVVMVRRRRRQG